MYDIAEDLKQVAEDVAGNLEACIAHPSHGPIALEALGHLADVLIDITSLEANGYPRFSREQQLESIYLLHREIVALGFCGHVQVQSFAARAAVGVMQLTARLRELQLGR